MLDLRWNWHPDPIVFTYFFTIRPGFVKGWNLHKDDDEHDSGELRPASPQLLREIRLLAGACAIDGGGRTNFAHCREPTYRRLAQAGGR